MKHLRKVIEFTPGFDWPTKTCRAYGEGSWTEQVAKPDQRFVDALAAAAWRELDRQNKFVIIPMGVDRHRIYSRQPFQKLAEIEGDRSEAVIELIRGILE